MAAAIQLMLTNMGIALGLTVLDLSPPSDSAATPSAEADSLPNQEDEFMVSITHLLGLGVAVTVSMVLFTTALLTVEFSQIAEPRRGGIFGIILWAAYWLLFAWLSSTTLSSIANSVLGTAIAGVRRLIAILRPAPPTQPTALPTIDQTLLRELATEIAQVTELKQSLPQLLAQQREQLIKEISDLTDLSPDEAKSVVDELDSDTTNYSSPSTSLTSSSLLSQLNLPNWQQILRQVLNQVDLSDLDIETLWHQLQSFSGESQPSSPEDDPVPVAAIPLDAEDFIRQARTWSFHPKVLQDTFYERLYDPEAAPEQIREQLASLDRTQFIEWLQTRDDIPANQWSAIADHLEHVRMDVMDKVATLPSETADVDPVLETAQKKLTAYCRYTNLASLTPSSLWTKIHAVHKETDLPEPLPLSLRTHIDLVALTDILSRRQGIYPEKEQAISSILQTAWGIPKSHEVIGATLPERLTHALSESLQTVDWSVVSLEALKPALLNQLQSLDIRGELDWVASTQHLQIPSAVKTELVDWLQETAQSLSRLPRRWAQRVGRSTESLLHQFTRQLSHYLQFQEKPALQPEHIAQDMVQIVNNVVGSLSSLPDLPNWTDIAQVLDVSTLGRELEKRRDMTLDDSQQVLDWLEAAWQKTIHQINTLPEVLWSEAHAIVQSEIDDLDAIRQQVVDRIEDTQAAVQAQAAAIKVDLQRQADATRRQVAIAAWWLFLSLLTSAASAGIAGWLAVQY